MGKARRGLWSEKSLKLAVKAVLVDGVSNVKASRRYGIPLETVRRKVLIARQGLGVEKKLGRHTVLTLDEENELCEILTDMESRLYGLTPIDVRRIVYQYCAKNNIRNTFNVTKELAGRYWFSGFLARHSNLSVRQAEAVSIQRAQGFNKPKVDRFYAVLKTIMFSNDGQQKVPASNIYNVDESGFTICQKPGKIVASKGKHNVGMLTSAEKGKTVTTVCCASATGDYVPPLIIFPRAKLRPSLMDHAPPGSVGAANKTGWMQQETFTQWFDHFLHHVQPRSRPEPTLLIMDGHTSHTNNIDVIEKARGNNVQLLVLPSHCTHRLQPLDISFFKSLNSSYNAEVTSWLRSHPGRAVTEQEIGELFNAAYGRAASVRNAVSGFQKAGISPFRDDIFTDDDFAGSWSTDQPQDGDHEPQVTAATGADQSTQSSTLVQSMQPPAGTDAIQSTESSVETSVQPPTDTESAQSSVEATLVQLMQPPAGTEAIQSTEPSVETSVQPPTDTESAQSSVETTPVQLMQPPAGTEAIQSTEPSAEASVLFVQPPTDSGPVQLTDSLIETSVLLAQPATNTDVVQSALARTASESKSIPCAVTENTSETTKLTLRELVGIPIQQEHQKRSSRKRKVGHACIITESPYKKMLLDAKEVKVNKDARREQRRRCQDEKKIEVEVKKRLKISGKFVNIVDLLVIIAGVKILCIIMFLVCYTKCCEGLIV